MILEPSNFTRTRLPTISGESQIFQNSIMYSSQSTANRPLLLVDTFALSCWLWQNPPLSNNDYWSSTQLLFKFPDKSCLNLLVSLDLWNWDRNYNSFLALYINFLGSGDD